MPPFSYFIDSGGSIAIVPPPPPEEMRQTTQQQNTHTRNTHIKEDITKSRLATHADKEQYILYTWRRIKKEKERKEKKIKKTPTQPNHIRSSRSSLRYEKRGQVLLTTVLGLVPCYPVCRLLPTPFANRGFPTTAAVVSPLPTSIDTTHTTDARRRLLSFTSFSRQLTMNRSAASRTPRYHLFALFAVVYSALFTPTTNGECSLDSSVARNTLEVAN